MLTFDEVCRRASGRRRVNALRRQTARQRLDVIAAMLDAGLPQAEIASRLDVNPSIVSRAVKRIRWARRARPHRRLILAATDAEIDALRTFELSMWLGMMDTRHKRKAVNSANKRTR